MQKPNTTVTTPPPDEQRQRFRTAVVRELIDDFAGFDRIAGRFLMICSDERNFSHEEHVVARAAAQHVRHLEKLTLDLRDLVEWKNQRPATLAEDGSARTVAR